ncbi:hypothetical protein DLJ49_20140 [Rhodovulum sp. 12E13]|nr:hypothetical protein DLJ49_20140 [Rhodovulum sp. 12E13]
MVTADASWFEDSSFPGLGFRDEEKVRRFKNAAVAFMKKHWSEEDVLFAVWEEDERAPHLHVYARRWKETTSKNRGRQALLQPTDMPLSKNPERAQDLAAAAFKHLGLVRGRRHAEERRQARREGRPVPKKPKVTSVRDWALEQSREREEAEKRAEAKARAEREAAEKARREAEAARQRHEDEARKIREALAAERAKFEQERDQEHGRIRTAWAAVETGRAEMEKRRRAFVEDIRKWRDLADHIRAAARHLGLTSHPLVARGLEAFEGMRDLAGRIGGRQRGE